MGRICSAQGQCVTVEPPPCLPGACDEANDTCLAPPTPTAITTPSPTQTVSPGGCPGDCNGDGMVAINELVLGVNIALGTQLLSAYPAFDTNATVAINEIVSGVNSALAGCN